jgi:hypothetical protein
MREDMFQFNVLSCTVLVSGSCVGAGVEWCDVGSRVRPDSIPCRSPGRKAMAIPGRPGIVQEELVELHRLLLLGKSRNFLSTRP